MWFWAKTKSISHPKKSCNKQNISNFESSYEVPVCKKNLNYKILNGYYYIKKLLEKKSPVENSFIYLFIFQTNAINQQKILLVSLNRLFLLFRWKTSLYGRFSSLFYLKSVIIYHGNIFNLCSLS